jgi:hypothetical protein
MTLDNFNQLVGSGINIYGSREKIRSQLVDYAKEYLQLRTVDFYKTSAISYIIDTLSILTANQLFYDSMIYREFFMVDAQMQESVYSLASWIGYEVPKAVPSKVDIMFTIPLTFNNSSSTFVIPNTFMAYADKIPFLIDSSDSSDSSTISAKALINTDNLTTIPIGGQIINNSAVIVSDANGFRRPIFFYTDSNNKNYASFTLPFTQHKRQIIQFIIPSSVQTYQFYSNVVKYNGMVSKMNVWVAEPKTGQKINLSSLNQDTFDPSIPVPTYGTGLSTSVPWVLWEEASSGIYTMGSGEQNYVFIGGQDSGEIFFGNGIVGKQPASNSVVTIELFVTLGEDGNVIPNIITKGDKLSYSITPILDSNGLIVNADKLNKTFNINYTITNVKKSEGGENLLSLPEIKRRAIINLRSKGKLVSDDDYNDINTIVQGEFPVVQSTPILKRSDIKINEIITYLRLQYHDENSLPQVVPTRNAVYSLYDYGTLFINEKYTILRNSQVIIDSVNYTSMYNVTVTKTSSTATYDYIAQNVTGSPVSVSDNNTSTWYQQYVFCPANTVDFTVDIPTTTDILSSSSSSQSTIYPLKVTLNVDHQLINQDNDYLPSELRCKMITRWGSNQEYLNVSESTVSDPSSGLTYPYDQKYSSFTFEIPNYLDIPTEIQRFEFSIEGLVILRDENGIPLTEDQVEGWTTIYKYYSDAMIRKDLSEVMISTVTKTYVEDDISPYTRYDIHDVPTILTSYIDAVLARADNSQYPNFEISVMQNTLKNLDISNKRMLTDFVNIKYPDTYGVLNNLKYNPTSFIVKSRFHTPFKWEDPTGITFDETVTYDFISSSSSQSNSTDLFIVNGNVPGYENSQSSLTINYIAQLYSGIGPNNTDIWYLTKPTRGMYIKVIDELDSYGDSKIIVFDGTNWIDAQNFKIPIEIELSIETDPTVTISQSTLKQNITDTLIEHFSPYMGVQKELDRSEILQVVKGVKGVKYAEVISPAIDIRFNYDISKDLTQAQLLNYTPQYCGFTSDSISIEIIQ